MRQGKRPLAPATAALALGVALAVAPGVWPLPADVGVPRAARHAGADAVSAAHRDAAGPARGRASAPPDVEAPNGQAGVRLELVAHHDLGGGGLHADVWLHRGVAYVGTTAEGGDPGRGCPGSGVKVVDLADPARPVLVGALAQHPGTSAEVMRVRVVETPAFRGDLLAVGLQACRDEGLRGLELWDVTDPRAPRPLAFSDVSPGTGGVHELDLVQRGDGRVLALLAVPASERGHPERLGDFRVVEVTDPRAPRPLASWGAQAGLGLSPDEGQGRDARLYGHSARAGAGGLRAYVSYWDAGVVILDLADPAAPRPLGRTGFAPGEEGNAHSVDLAHDERVLVQADEVLEVEVGALRVDGPPGVAGPIAAGGTLPAPPWEETAAVTGELADLGRGCPAGDWTAQLGAEARLDVADPYAHDPRGRIALLERGLCPFADKLERAKAAGALGSVIINTAEGPLTPSSPQGSPVGAFGIPRSAGERLKAELAAGRPVVVTLGADLRAYQDYGGLRFWDIADPARPRAVGAFRTARSRVDRARGPAEPGPFSAHNPVVQGDLLFVSWTGDGVRVVDIRDPAAPREVAAWVPPVGEAPGAVRSDLGQGPAVWGVAVEGDLVVASDTNRGLYALRLVR
jgi:hypothetical protein